jgi:hypothetical protein
LRVVGLDVRIGFVPKFDIVGPIRIFFLVGRVLLFLNNVCLVQFAVDLVP